MKYNHFVQAKHGGDIYRHTVKLDYSVNINPLGMPGEIVSALQEAVFHCDRYPDDTCQELIQVLAEKTGLKEDQILCGNGASDILMGIVHAIRPKKALVFAPSFYGYIHALLSVGCEIVYEVLQEKECFQIPVDFAGRIPEDIDMLFLCIPNNPTGVLLPKEQLLAIFQQCKKKGIYVVLDECFLEFTKDYQELSGEQFVETFPNLCVVNAFTKTYAIPGIRLGYACAEPSLISKIASQLAEWRVSIPAMAAGLAALRMEQKDGSAYLERTRELLAQERQYLMGEFDKMGICYYPSEADFILFQSKLPLYELLLERGILIRHAANYKGLSKDYYRIAVKKHEDNIVLIRMLQELIQKT